MCPMCVCVEGGGGRRGGALCNQPLTNQSPPIGPRDPLTSDGQKASSGVG